MDGKLLVNLTIKSGDGQNTAENCITKMTQWEVLYLHQRWTLTITMMMAPSFNQEVDKAIQSLGCGKSVGEDSIQAEMLKSGGDHIIMTEALENHTGTVTIGRQNMTNLKFADNIDGLAGSEDEIR